MDTKIVVAALIAILGVGSTLGLIFIVINQPPPPLPIIRQAGNFNLQNEDNITVTLANFTGKVLLIDFIYTNCPDPNFCPLSTFKMSEVQNILLSKGFSQNDFHLLSISFDYIYDGPIQMKAYGENNQANFSVWSFLSGNKTQIDEVTAAYGVASYIQNTSNTSNIIHSMKFSLIDTLERIRYENSRNDWTVNDIVDKVIRLVREKT
jgi:protein SCO1/2